MALDCRPATPKRGGHKTALGLYGQKRSQRQEKIISITSYSDLNQKDVVSVEDEASCWNPKTLVLFQRIYDFDNSQ